MTLIEALQRKHRFTTTEEMLADFVLAHPNEVVAMSASQLAKAAHTSNSAIVRFCSKLGIDGYRSFNVTLARELERRSAQRIDINPDEPFLEGASTQEVIDSVAALTKQAVDAAHDTVRQQDIRTAARFVRLARRVVIYANGDTRISAIGFSNLMLKLGVICSLGDQYGEATSMAYTLGPNDVALFVSYSGGLIDASAYSLERELDIVRKSGCKTIFITSDETIEEHAGKADCVIVLPQSETRKGRIANYYSQTTIRYVLNCIYGEVFAHNWEGGIAARDRYASTDAWV
ncbi:MAG: MurR/RpiR family transcriptional regulator [Atopobiaceae bacterium]|nr:MurR/RpiR family transcriptional regulator [Atopobiaceae bacterium]